MRVAIFVYATNLASVISELDEHTNNSIFPRKGVFDLNNH